MKCCTVCKVAKPSDEFNVYTNSKDGLDSRCRECINAYRRKRREGNPDAFKRYVKTLKRLYNLTIEQFDEMMLNQGGMCAICDQEAFLVVDHDHKTGKVRQLLCRGCNCAIGNLKDSTELAAKAGEYLKKHKTP